MSVESSAVLAVKNLLDFNPYINTDYLNVGDKYPSYDGEILIYNNSQGKKEGLNQVKVQIKGESEESFPESTSYKVSCTDLENYKRLGGCLFFVVRINSSAKTKCVYYNTIYPMTAKRLLAKKKAAQKTISLKFIPFPHEIVAQSDLLLNFALECLKQTSYANAFVLDSKSFVTNTEKLVMSYSSYDKSLINPAEYFLNKKMFAYRQLDNGLEIPYDEITFSHSSEPVKGIISVLDKTYYTHYTIVREVKKPNKVFINPSFYFIMDKDNKKITYHYEIKGNLRARIHDLKFITQAFKNNGFNINNIKMDFVIDGAEKQYLETNALKEKYETIQKALNVAGVSTDLDYDRIIDADIRNLILLEKIFIKKEPLFNISLNCIPFCMLRIANISIPLYVTRDKQDNTKFNAINVFDADIVIGENAEDMEKGLVSTYCTKLKFEELKEISNLNYDKMYDQISNVPPTDFHLKMTNDFLLNIILLYDVNLDENTYKFAISLAEWLKKYSNEEDNIFNINYLQLKRRKANLDVEDIEKLINICKNTNDNAIKFACLILLDKQEEAMKHFEKLDSDYQNAIKKMPIFKFVKEK